MRLRAELREVAVKHENESAHVSNLRSNRRTRLLIVLLFGVGVLLFTLMTAFPNAASVFAFSGLALMAISGVLAISNWARTREKGEKGVGLVAMVVAAVLGYLAASYLIPVGEPTSSQIGSPNLSVTQNAVSSSGEPSMAQVGQDSVGSGLYSSESTVLRIASDLISVEGSRAQNIVSERLRGTAK